MANYIGRIDFKSQLWINHSRWRIYTYCLMKANRNKQYKTKINGEEFILTTGEFITGRKVGARETGLTEPNFWKELLWLKDNGIIDIKSKRGRQGFSVVSVVELAEAVTFKVTELITNKVTIKTPDNLQENKEVTTQNKNDSNNLSNNKSNNKSNIDININTNKNTNKESTALDISKSKNDLEISLPEKSLEINLTKKTKTLLKEQDLKDFEEFWVVAERIWTGKRESVRKLYFDGKYLKRMERGEFLQQTKKYSESQNVKDGYIFKFFNFLTLYWKDDFKNGNNNKQQKGIHRARVTEQDLEYIRKYSG